MISGWREMNSGVDANFALNEGSKVLFLSANLSKDVRDEFVFVFLDLDSNTSDSKLKLTKLLSSHNLYWAIFSSETIFQSPDSSDSAH